MHAARMVVRQSKSEPTQVSQACLLEHRLLNTFSTNVARQRDRSRAMQRTVLPRLAVYANVRPHRRAVVTMAAATVQLPAAYEELCKKLRDLNALNGACAVCGSVFPRAEASPVTVYRTDRLPATAGSVISLLK